MKKVLVYLNSLVLGGIEIQFLRSLDHLRSEGISIDFCCCQSGGEIEQQFRDKGCKIYKSRKHIVPELSAITINKITKANKFDLIHSQFGYTSGAAALASKISNTPIVISAHSDVPGSLMQWKGKFLLHYARTAWLQHHKNLGRKYCKQYVGHSKVNSNALINFYSVPPSQVRTIPNGVSVPPKLPNRQNSRAELNLNNNQIIILHVGNFTAFKNQEAAVEIFNGCLNRGLKAMLIFVGDGDRRKIVEKRVSDLRLTSHIRFEGKQVDVWKYYSAADIFLFPSLKEGFGNALVEAQFSKLPVVASKIPAHFEAVAPQQQDNLFHINDMSQAEETIIRISRSPKGETQNEVEESHRFVSRHFSIASHAKQLCHLYREMFVSQI